MPSVLLFWISFFISLMKFLIYPGRPLKVSLEILEGAFLSVDLQYLRNFAVLFQVKNNLSIGSFHLNFAMIGHDFCET